MSRSLILNISGPQGHIKTWKLKSSQGAQVFGSSRLADIRVIDFKVPGVDGVFEFKKDQWVFTDLQSKNMGCSTLLTKKMDITRGELKIECTPQEVSAPLLEKVLKTFECDDVVTGQLKTFHLVVVSKYENLLEVKLFDEIPKEFKTRYVPGHSIPVATTNSWKHDEVDGFCFDQKTLKLTDEQALKFITKKQLLDESGRKTLMATSVGGLLLLGLFLISPNGRDAKEAAVAAVKPKTTRVMTVSLPKTKPEKIIEVAAGGGSGASSSARKPASLTEMAQSRLSKLIGKISSAPALSKNLVAANGMEAGTQPTGQALAALSNKDQDGTDWTKESKNNKGTVSGLGGGNVNGMGSLKNGKTGTSNIGVLEEESEISGGLDREVIAQYIKTQLGQILYCYERQLSANPDLFGKVAVKFVIGSNGGVETQNIRDTTLKDQTVEKCMLQKIAKWKFPEPKGGTQVVVTYPFLFKSTN